MNNLVFGKTMENVRKHGDIKLVTTEKRSHLLSKPNYHTAKWFSENLLKVKMNKIKIEMNKLVYLGLSIQDISKIVMYEYWYYYLKPKYGNTGKLYYMDTDHFIVNMKQKMFMATLQKILRIYFAH